ncbi:hypothetical protein LCGC14_0462250 [marine sediment metagenome]|uniref:Uncharacterized protein n=1 Tax=marine sediment metagenome TaxID=412755 RepID=A0A0F9V1H5_9ZZZZ
MEKEEIKVRYHNSELEAIKEKAEKLGISPNEYQLEISKKAEVKIEVKNDL